MNDLKEIKDDIDRLFVETTLAQIHIKTLTQLVLGAFSEILSEEKAKILKLNYYHILNNEKNRLSALSEILHNPKLALKEEFELHSYIQDALRGLED